MTERMQAAAEFMDLALIEVLKMRTELAKYRDSLLTEAELVAKLDVYAEFGR